MFKNCKDVKRRNFSAWKVKFYSIRNIYTQMFNSNRYIMIYNDPLKWYSKSITKFNSPQRSREHRNFLHAWKMKFLFLFDWRNWLFRIVVLIIMEGIVISSITKFNFTFIKNLKIQTRASFLFEKCNHSIRNIYTTECVECTLGRAVTRARNHAFPVQDATNTFLWLLPIFSVGKVRLSIPSRMNFNGEENRASYFWGGLCSFPRHSNENISRPWYRILLPRQRTTKPCRNEIVEINEFFSIEIRPISTPIVVQPINKFDWLTDTATNGPRIEVVARCAHRWHDALDRAPIDRFDSPYWCTLDEIRDLFYYRRIKVISKYTKIPRIFW